MGKLFDECLRTNPFHCKNLTSWEALTFIKLRKRSYEVQWSLKHREKCLRAGSGQIILRAVSFPAVYCNLMDYSRTFTTVSFYCHCHCSHNISNKKVKEHILSRPYLYGQISVQNQALDKHHSNLSFSSERLPTQRGMDRVRNALWAEMQWADAWNLHNELHCRRVPMQARIQAWTQRMCATWPRLQVIWLLCSFVSKLKWFMYEIFCLH